MTTARRGLTLLTPALVVALVGSVSAQPEPPPYALTGTLHGAAVAATAFGGALAVCTDGRIVVGAAGTANAAGAVRVFAAAGSLLRVLDDPLPVAGDRFGAAVACAGSAVLVGAPGADLGGDDAGAAYLIDADEQSPTVGTVLRTLTAPVPHAGDAFGFAVAAGGTYLVAAAPFADDGGEDAGAVFVFDANPVVEPLVVTGAPPTAGDYFGAAVALHGNRLLVGAPFDSATAASAGAAHLVTLGGVPVGVTGRHVLRAPQPLAGAELGTAVALAAARAVVGAPFEKRGSGAAYVFGLDGTLEHVLRRPTRVPQDAFGASVAVSDADVAVGAPVAATGAGSPPGAVVVFGASDGGFRALLPDPLARSGGRFGAAVAASGTAVFAGAPGIDRVVRVFAPCGGVCAAGCGNGIVEPVTGAAHEAADACDQAFAIDALPFRDTIDVGDATASPGDPPHPGCASGVNTGSVWYRFTSTIGGVVVMDATQSDYPAILAVYSGGCIAPVVQSCQTAGGPLAVLVQAGVTYLIEAAGGSGRLDLFVGPSGSAPEPCDDGNLTAGDGCNPGCVRPTTTTTITTTTTTTFQTSSTTTTTSTTIASTTTTTLPGVCDADDDCTAGDVCRDPGRCRVCNGCGLITWPCCGKPRRCAPGVPRADGFGCDDADACTRSDVCAGGACAGAPRSCPALGPCDTGVSCDANTGACVVTPRLDGVGCDDGDPCVQNRTCVGGVCQGGTPVVCPDDGRDCTTESCTPPTGCTSVPSACTCTGDADCAGANPCLVGRCIASVCGQTPVADGTTCPAASACVTAGTCQTGVCAAGSTIRCDDGDACTADLACEPQTGCPAVPLDCFDGVTCRLTRWQATAPCASVTLPITLRGMLERTRRVVLSASLTGPQRARVSLGRATRSLGKGLASAQKLARGGSLPSACADLLRADLRQARTRLRGLTGASLRACLTR